MSYEREMVRMHGDFIDLIRTGQPFMKVITPAEMIRIRREIAIREAMEREEGDGRELQRRRKERGW